MRSISLRNIPDEVYGALQTMAKANRRSLQEQIKWVLEKEVNLLKGSALSKASAWRKRLTDRDLSDTVAQIREDRKR